MNDTTAVAAAIALAALPVIGQPLESGLFAGLTTDKNGQHCAVVLLADKPDAKLSWQAATAWAESLGAQLPTRPVAALLFAHLKPQFEPSWYWTSEEDADDSESAWGQDFDDGVQNGNRKSYEGRARAVRLIHLSA